MSPASVLDLLRLKMPASDDAPGVVLFVVTGGSTALLAWQTAPDAIAAFEGLMPLLSL